MAQPCVVIAEIGSNHNRDLDEARWLIDAAAAAGCDAAKFQTYSADTLYSRLAPRLSEMSTFQGDDGEISPHDLIARLEMPREWHAQLAAHCAGAGIEFMSTAFDLQAVEDLHPYVRRHKIASYDLTNRPLVEACARSGKSLIISTGHGTLGEVEEALHWVREANAAAEIVLLHCTSQYPTKPSDANLRALAVLATAFQLPVGLSDHTLDGTVPIAAVALGATVIEKHFTRDRAQSGPDHSFALEPGPMAAMVRAIRDVGEALGDGIKAPRTSEAENRRLARRSIHLTHDVPAGHVLGGDDLIMLRPGTGIRPADLDLVVGRAVRRAMVAGTAVTWDDV